MLFKLAWGILGARRFVQMKCPGSQMALPPERGIFLKKCDEPLYQMQN